jgi:hypothetical protein
MQIRKDGYEGGLWGGLIEYSKIFGKSTRIFRKARYLGYWHVICG